MRAKHSFKSIYKIECFRRYIRILIYNFLLPRRKNIKINGSFKVGLLKRGGIGDWIIFAPALEQMRKKNPNAEISIYTEKRQVEIIQLINIFDRIIEISPSERKGLLSRHTFLSKLRKENYDLWIDADISRTNLGDAASLASASPIRIGYTASHGAPCHAMIEKKAFTHTLKDNLDEVHMSERFEKLLNYASSLMPREEFINRNESKNPINGLKRFNWDGAQSGFFVVAPGASSPIRMWPIAKFVELIKSVTSRYGLVPILIGTNTDKPACDAIIRLLDHSEIINRAGLDRINDVFDLISKARLLVTNESGPMHIGYATQTPTLAVVSGADFTSYSSYPTPNPNFHIAHSADQSCFNCHWNCIHPNLGKNVIKPCLDTASVPEALRKIDMLLQITGTKFNENGL